MIRSGIKFDFIDCLILFVWLKYNKILRKCDMKNFFFYINIIFECNWWC